MAIKRNYFFEELTEEDPTPLSNDPNLNDYDKTDSYSQYLDYDDVAGTVDIDLGDGKDEELDGDGTPSLEQSILEDVIFDEAYTAYLTEAKIESKEDLERELAKLDGKPNAAVGAAALYASMLTYFGGVFGAGFGGPLAGVKVAAKTGSKIAGAAAGIGTMAAITTVTVLVINFIAKQSTPKAQKIRAAKRVIKEIDKAIVKAEKSKNKEGADTKAIDKYVKELKKARDKAQKKQIDFESLPDNYKESYNYRDFYYMEENDIMDGIFLDAMQESYMDDIRIMEAIAKSNSMMHILSEADVDDDTKEEAKSEQKQTIIKRIIEAIKKFFENVRGVIDRIIGWFKEKFNSIKNLIKGVENSPEANNEEEATAEEAGGADAAMDAGEKLADKAAEKVENFDKIIDKIKSGNTIVKADANAIIFTEKELQDVFNQTGGENKWGMSFYQFASPEYLGNEFHVKEIEKAIQQIGESASEYFLNEADDSKKEKPKFKVRVKERIAKIKEWFKRHSLFKKAYSKIARALQKTEKKLKEMDPNAKDFSKLSKAFTTMKRSVLAGLKGGMNLFHKAYKGITGFIKRIAGKIFKKKNPGEATDKVSEAAIGEMIYAHYAMQEADVTFGDGVDVTDVMDSTIGDGETITKEKTVCVNNESYRVKVSATRI